MFRVAIIFLLCAMLDSGRAESKESLLWRFIHPTKLSLGADYDGMWEQAIGLSCNEHGNVSVDEIALGLDMKKIAGRISEEEPLYVVLELYSQGGWIEFLSTMLGVTYNTLDGQYVLKEDYGSSVSLRGGASKLRFKAEFLDADVPSLGFGVSFNDWVESCSLLAAH